MYGYTDVYLGDVEAEVQFRVVARTCCLHLDIVLFDVVVLQASQTKRYGSAHIREDVGRNARIEVELNLIDIRNGAVPLVVVHKVELRATIRALQFQLTKDAKAASPIEGHIGTMEYRE